MSRSIFALMDDRDRSYFGRGGEDQDQIAFIDERSGAIFGRSSAAKPDALIKLLKKDEAIAEADTLLLTVPNQLGVAYNVHAIEAILTHIAPRLGGAEASFQTPNSRSGLRARCRPYARSRPPRCWPARTRPDLPLPSPEPIGRR